MVKKIGIFISIIFMTTCLFFNFFQKEETYFYGSEQITKQEFDDILKSEHKELYAIFDIEQGNKIIHEID